MILFVQQNRLKKRFFDKNVELDQIKESLKSQIKVERADAIKKSKAVVKGQIVEHISPFLPDFPYKSSDLKALFAPIDFVLFNGLSDGQIKEIVFIDIKTGSSQLTKSQKEIKTAIENNQVKFLKWQPNLTAD